MIKLFDRDGKWNWVDHNNVVVGYSNEPSCCERFGYSYSNKQPTKSQEARLCKDTPNLEELHFNPLFRLELDDSHEFDYDSTIVFELINSLGQTVSHLCIWNVQNGYYSHGFEMMEDGKLTYSGRI